MPSMEFVSMTTREEMDLEAIFAAHPVTEGSGEMICIGPVINSETEPVKDDRPYGCLGCLSIFRNDPMLFIVNPPADEP